MENLKTYDFSKIAKVGNDFQDKNFKDEFVLSIRLSYGDEKQKGDIYKQYVKFLQDLKIIDTSNKILVNYKKSSQYYFVFEKTQEYDNYFTQLEKYLENLEEDNDYLQSLLECKNDIYNINFTISNFEEKQNKIKNFIKHCKDNNLIK